LDLVFKIAPISDHVVKFRDDQPTDRDLALNKKMKKERKKERNNSKTWGSPLRYHAMGGPNNGNDTWRHEKQRRHWWV